MPSASGIPSPDPSTASAGESNDLTTASSPSLEPDHTHSHVPTVHGTTGVSSANVPASQTLLIAGIVGAVAVVAIVVGAVVLVLRRARARKVNDLRGGSCDDVSLLNTPKVNELDNSPVYSEL